LSRLSRRAWSLALAALVALTLPALAATTAPSKPAAKKPAAAVPVNPPAPSAATPKPAPAAPKPAVDRDDAALDAIAALVNDEPVRMSDVEEQLYLMLRNAQAQPDSSELDTLRREVLDQLIDEKLIVAEAKRQGLTASAAEVNRQIDARLAEVKERIGGEVAFQQQLRKENTTEAKLRERYKADLEQQMIADRVVQKNVPRKTVTPAEAEAFYLAHKDKFPKVPAELRLQVVQIVPSADSAALAAGRTRIDALRKRIVAGEKFAKIAAEASDDDGTAKSGGDLSFIRRGEMPPAIEDAAFSLKDGELSQPVRSMFGWHLVQAIERDTVRGPDGRDSLDVSGAPIVEVHARHIMVKVEVTQKDIDRALAKAQAVRAQAAKGGDFTALVKAYSEYKGQVGPDGDLGFLSLGKMQPAIRAGLETLAPGEVSDVLPNAQGLNIFKVLERHAPRDYDVAEIREELPQAVAQIQFRERLEAWVKTLRAKAQIEYRNP
jgi:peptidyl-prolyl cis-trans isomerase SurA